MKTLFKIVLCWVVFFGCVLITSKKCIAQQNNLSRTYISATSLLAGVGGAFDSAAVKNYVARVHNTLLYGDGNKLNGTGIGAMYYNPTSGKWRVYSPNNVNILPPNFPIVYDSTRWFDLVLGGASGGGLTAPRIPYSTGSPSTFTDKSTFTFIAATNTVGGGANFYGIPSATLAGISAGSYAGDPSTPGDGGIWHNSVSATLNARINGTAVTLLPMTLAGLADNSIPVMSGNVARRYSTFAFDGTNLYLGQSTSLAVGGFSSRAQITGTSADAAGLSITRFVASAGNPVISFAHSRGASIGSFTAVQNNDGLFQIDGVGADGTDLSTRAVQIAATVNGAVSTGIVPGQLAFKTANTSGVLTTRLTLDAAGLSTFSGRVVATSSATLPGINVGSFAGNPSTLANGDFYYNSSTNQNRMVVSGSAQTIAGLEATQTFTGTNTFNTNMTTFGERINTTLSSNRAAINIAGNASDPATLVNGDLWYHSSEHRLKTRINSTSQGVLTDDKVNLNRTITAGGTTGNQTINKTAGCVNFAAAASTLTVTNSLVDANSIIFATVETNDATALLKNVVPAAGSFVIRLNANTTAETKVCFMVTN